MHERSETRVARGTPASSRRVHVRADAGDFASVVQIEPTARSRAPPDESGGHGIERAIAPRWRNGRGASRNKSRLALAERAARSSHGSGSAISCALSIDAAGQCAARRIRRARNRARETALCAAGGARRVAGRNCWLTPNTARFAARAPASGCIATNRIAIYRPQSPACPTSRLLRARMRGIWLYVNECQRYRLPFRTVISLRMNRLGLIDILFTPLTSGERADELA